VTQLEAVERLNRILAHAWMVRTFLKHAEEIQDDADMLDVPRTLYDSIRAVEPAYQRQDWDEYLRRLKGKLPKFRRVAEYYNANFRTFSPHTNFEMAGLSLTGIVAAMEEIFSRDPKSAEGNASSIG
jgi:thioesterase domain-containing protein